MRRLIDLKHGQCRYPTSGHREPVTALCAELPHARHLFCGSPVAEPGRSYCEEHAKLCYIGDGRDWLSLYETLVRGEDSVRYLYAIKH